MSKYIKQKIIELLNKNFFVTAKVKSNEIYFDDFGNTGSYTDSITVSQSNFAQTGHGLCVTPLTVGRLTIRATNTTYTRVGPWLSSTKYTQYSCDITSTDIGKTKDLCVYVIKCPASFPAVYSFEVFFVTEDARYTKWYTLFVRKKT